MTGAGYSGTPLAAKLGAAPGTRVLLLGAPDGFDLGVPYQRRPGRAPYPVILVFCPDRAALRRRWPGAAGRTTERGALWIAWPKKASGVPTDLTENDLRAHALPLGWVDVKVCAVDATWSGLKFVRRRTPPAPAAGR
jgi:hypothetical protein